MTEPPGPDPSGRPQDTPRFPTYGRPGSSPTPPYQQQASPYQSPGTPLPYQGQPYQGTPYQGRPYQGEPQWNQLPPYPTPYGTPGQGYGYPGPDRTNGVAIAALITGLSSILFVLPAPVAVVLGIVALVQLRRSPEKGFAQAVVGLVVGALVTLFWAALLVVGFLLAEDSDASGPPAPSASSVGIDELLVGECFTETDDESTVDRVPCGIPHDGEFFASVDLPAGAYPGDRQVADRSETACETSFAGYIGIPIDDSELNLASWSPERAAWEDGDRRALCAVYGPGDDQVTGSLKGSRR